jgi:multidrug/hemolysin transport system ATP-binding protein
MNVIEINHLFKSYKDVKAVSDLSFRVKKGEFFSFLGVNGAGKSTTISIICGQNNKDSGDVLVLGKDITKDRDEITRKIGVVFQNSHLDKKLNAFDNLKSRAALYGIYGEAFKKRFDELAELLDFKDFIKRPLEKLSGGQKRRIDIARALFHNPEILILDEPTTGLDPQTRKLLWNVINNLRKEKNLTVFLTTHYMEEASESDYVVILNKGEVAAEGTPIELKNKYSSDYITIYNNNNIPDFGYPVEQFKDYIRIKVPNTKAATDLLLKHPDYFTDYEITKGKMDDVFLTVTGSNAMEENI